MKREGAAVAVAMFLDLPDATTEQYDELNEAMGTTRPEDEPEGLIFHVCVKNPDGGLLICDVWRSQAEVEDFLTGTLGPAAAKLGLPQGPAPRFGEVHYQVNPR